MQADSQQAGGSQNAWTVGLKVGCPLHTLKRSLNLRLALVLRLHRLRGLLLPSTAHCSQLPQRAPNRPHLSRPPNDLSGRNQPLRLQGHATLPLPWRSTAIAVVVRRKADGPTHQAWPGAWLRRYGNDRQACRARRTMMTTGDQWR